MALLASAKRFDGSYFTKLKSFHTLAGSRKVATLFLCSGIGDMYGYCHTRFQITLKFQYYMRISRLFMLAVACIALFGESCNPFPTQQTDEAIQAVMNEFNAVGISAAVVKNGKIVYNNSFGYKDLAGKVPLSNDDVMRIASISKSFTATSL